MSRVLHPRLTGEEFELIAEAHGWSLEAELVGGEAVVIPPDGPHASLVQGELFLALRRWQEGSGDRGLALQSVFVRIAELDRLGPDVAWWAQRPAGPLPVGQMLTAPDWVAEVLSPSTRENDLGPKRDAYLAAGVRELWLVDPVQRTVTVVDATGRESVAAKVSRSGVLDGFAVVTASLWPD